MPDARIALVKFLRQVFCFPSTQPRCDRDMGGADVDWGIPIGAGVGRLRLYQISM